MIQSQTKKKVKRQISADVKTANRCWVLITWDMVARIQTCHFQSYKLQLPTVITRAFPLDGLQEVKLSMGFQFKRLTIKRYKNRNESFNSVLISVILNHLKCKTPNARFLWFLFLFQAWKFYPFREVGKF